ncbi:hypothetical protein N8T08_004060 [Aspergillus melleus]|uniref:Uncharacterized protein n=1 Tax=Aspergillus melleus TaxID=138277 RepID=A0ACC3B599_9EURO|nr:hypothetical protein N8T08_004060 [Aspergillus melleus]
MSGCIKNDLDAPSDKLQVHVSQNRHEIFIIIAEYDSGYVSYLKEMSADDEPQSFLTMHQYGPWNTESAGDMRKLGPILLALTLYAEAEVKKAEDLRRSNGTCNRYLCKLWKQASSRCSHRQEAPEPATGDMSSIFYCTKTCQTEHWPAHRAECKVRGYRKKLCRTAVILKAAFLVYRPLKFDVELSNIELRSSTLFLYDNQKNLSVPAKRSPFPEHLTTNAEHREAALCSLQCSAAFSLVCRLAYKLLVGVPCHLETLSVNVGKRLLATQNVPGPDSPNIPAPNCAKCGFKDVLVPYTNYMSTHQCSIAGGPAPYDYTETYDIDKALPFANSNQKAMLEAERLACERFASFANGVNKDLLGGPSTEFEDKFKAFKTTLKRHMYPIHSSIKADWRFTGIRSGTAQSCKGHDINNYGLMRTLI